MIFLRSASFYVASRYRFCNCTDSGSDVRLSDSVSDLIVQEVRLRLVLSKVVHSSCSSCSVTA